MKYKTAELEGALLDAAVAKALGWERGSNWCSAPGKPGLLLVFGEPEEFSEEPRFAPSAVWADGGPIIERERIEVTPEWETIEDEGLICAGWMASVGVDVRQWFGSDPLTAAMRAYVASRFGEEVELP